MFIICTTSACDKRVSVLRQKTSKSYWVLSNEHTASYSYHLHSDASSTSTNNTRTKIAVKVQVKTDFIPLQTYMRAIYAFLQQSKTVLVCLVPRQTSEVLPFKRMWSDATGLCTFLQPWKSFQCFLYRNGICTFSSHMGGLCFCKNWKLCQVNHFIYEQITLSN